jgi:O-antigen/teichoic acid export membrane protein
MSRVADERVPDEDLTSSEIRERALTGAGVLGVRGVALRLVALGGNVVLARLLLPRDFGAVAFGSTLIVLLTVAGDAGMGAGLIRRKDPPSREDLRAVLAVQLTLTLVLSAITVAIAAPFGRTGLVTLVMVAALPFTAVKAPAVVMTERRLRYRPIMIVEVAESLLFYGWAIGTVAAGWGVWGFASAAVVRSLVGAGLMLALVPDGRVLPRFSWSRVRSLLGFGARFQAVAIADVGRDQAINAGTAVISGIGTLGIWNLANKVLQVPYQLFEPLWRVSFPAMARLAHSDEDDMRAAVERATSMTAVSAGVILAVLAGSAPAGVPAVFGSEWTAASGIIPWACIGLMVGGPVAVGTAGYLYAVGRAGRVLAAVGGASLVWIAVTLSLLPAIGPPAFGLGWMAHALVEAAVLGTGGASATGARIARQIAVPAAVALVSGAAGWAVASALDPSLASAAAAAAVAGGGYVIGLLVLAPRLLRDALGMSLRALRGGMMKPS